MKVSLIVAAVVLLALALGVTVKARAQLLSGDGPSMRVRDVPGAIAQLRQQGREHSFLVLMFDPPGQAGAEAINLQLSIDKGRLGLDWVLLSSSNVADRAKIESLLRKRGQPVREIEMNGVRFLRVEEGDLTALASAVLSDIYKLAPDAKLGTVVEGFRLSAMR